MPETKTVYYIDNSVACPTCGLCVGHYVTEGKETWLQMGMIRASAIHGKCASCGAEFHFVVSDKKLEQLLARCGK